VSGASGQELMQGQRYIPKTVYKTPPVWQTNKGLRLSGYATVFPHSYRVWDVQKNVKGSRQKVSVELLDDGTFMVYFPLEKGEKTAYIHIEAGFNGLGLLIHEIFYGDPNGLVKSEPLEGQ
jgi:hypothetical protein